jgi:tetratricopeptide (TPR) repeat protein
MATALAIELSSRYSDWATVFELQNESRYSEALQALSSVSMKASGAGIYSQLLNLHLRMCVDATKRIEPSDHQCTELFRIAEQAGAVGQSSIQVEALFLIFDAFKNSREGASLALGRLENQMDEHTRRRWCHRKGIAFIAEGKLHDAHSLLTKAAIEIPESVEDFDDSLCSLLLDLGRLSTELGKYSDAVDIYGQALACSRSPHNQGLSLIRLSNALERMSRPAQADKRRIEYFHLIKREYPIHCAACSGQFGKEPKFLIPCCKTIVHSECLRQVVSDVEANETECPFCATLFHVSDVVDPSAVEGRKYKKHRRGGTLAEAEPSLDN